MYSNGKRRQICVETDLLATRYHCSQKLNALLQVQKMGGIKWKKRLWRVRKGSYQRQLFFKVFMIDGTNKYQ